MHKKGGATLMDALPGQDAKEPVEYDLGEKMRFGVRDNTELGEDNYLLEE